jgi:hypothetical protein
VLEANAVAPSSTVTWLMTTAGADAEIAIGTAATTPSPGGRGPGTEHLTVDPATAQEPTTWLIVRILAVAGEMVGTTPGENVAVRLSPLAAFPPTLLTEIS